MIWHASNLAELFIKPHFHQCGMQTRWHKLQSRKNTTVPQVSKTVNLSVDFSSSKMNTVYLQRLDNTQHVNSNTQTKNKHLGQNGACPIQKGRQVWPNLHGIRCNDGNGIRCIPSKRSTRNVIFFIFYTFSVNLLSSNLPALFQ